MKCVEPAGKKVEKMKRIQLYKVHNSALHTTNTEVENDNNWVVVITLPELRRVMEHV